MLSVFKRKAKVILDEFCTGFYDEHFFSNDNLSHDYYQMVIDKLIQTDISLLRIDREYLAEELRIVHLELFSLAWFHRFGHKQSVFQSVFTKKYLEEMYEDQIWEEMDKYNQAIAKSTIHGLTSETQMGRYLLTDINETRIRLFKMYHRLGIDGVCIARVLNKYGTKESWQKLAIILHYIALELCEIFGIIDFKDEAKLVLVSVFKGFYEGSKEALDRIKIIEKA